MTSVGRGLVYISVAATAWGTGGAAAALLYSDSGLGPIAVSFWRFVGGIILLALVRGFSWPKRWRDVLITGVGLAIYQTAYFAAVGYGGLAIATVVTLGSGPILIAVGARFTMAERLGRTGLAMVGMALLGLVLLVVGGGESAGTQPLLGILLALLSAVGYAGVTLLNRRVGQSDPNGLALPGFVVGMVCLFPLALAEGLLPTRGSTVETLALLFYLGAVPTALAYGLFFAGLRAVRATTASVVALIEPVTAAVIAAVLLHERLSAAAIVGSTILLGAVLLLALGERTQASIPT